jgi:hypothetical protein
MVNGRTRLKGVIVCGNGNDADGGSNIKLYNGTSATGTPLLEMEAGDYSEYGGTQMLPIPGNGILFDSGIYMVKEYNVTGVVSLSITFQGGSKD